MDSNRGKYPLKPLILTSLNSPNLKAPTSSIAAVTSLTTSPHKGRHKSGFTIAEYSQV